MSGKDKEKDRSAISITLPSKTARETAAIILAGGDSQRFGENKGLTPLLGKPMIMYVYEKASAVANEVLVVLSSRTQFKQYERCLGRELLRLDEFPSHTPLVGAYTGFKHINSEYTFLLSCDTPLLSVELLLLLLKTTRSANAVIPRHPNNYVEPLQAIYRTRDARKASHQALVNERLNLRSMIDLLDRVVYLPTDRVKEFDPHLLTFLNVNTKSDLKRAEKVLSKRVFTVGNK